LTFLLVSVASYFYLFIYEHLLKYLSSVVDSVVVMALLLTSFYIAANKEYLTKIQIIFRCVNAEFLRLYCLKFSFKLANISRSYDDVLGVHFLSGHSLYGSVLGHFQAKARYRPNIAIFFIPLDFTSLLRGFPSEYCHCLVWKN